MKKLSKMTLLHVEKMSDSEMKQILGGNSFARQTGDNCYEDIFHLILLRQNALVLVLLIDIMIHLMVHL